VALTISHLWVRFAVQEQFYLVWPGLSLLSAERKWMSFFFWVFCGPLAGGCSWNRILRIGGVIFSANDGARGVAFRKPIGLARAGAPRGWCGEN